ncbi:CEX2-like protein [Mya arenaria]|uniref:CEX2-like protein n=1 Tax=Mya arenaria TaxID=6604 RepID=A0ABY7FN14_MYAAR|nr:CEX2-like protein [Mya arenaria]
MCFEWIYTTEKYKNRKKEDGLVSAVSGFFRRGGRKMGLVLGLFKPELSDFQKRKLLYEFHTFFARTKICELSGWKAGTPRHVQTNELFKEIWRRLQDDGDENFDGKISEDEWIKMWESFNRQYIEQLQKKESGGPEPTVPAWLDKYMEYKFNLLDRTGNGYVDVDEFEYVMSDFGVSSREARNAFTIFSQNNERKLDLEYFKQLCTEYYRSDDPGALGNFINGKLDFLE